jgi:hypothetical protein
MGKEKGREANCKFSVRGVVVFRREEAESNVRLCLPAYLSYFTNSISPGRQVLSNHCSRGP